MRLAAALLALAVPLAPAPAAAQAPPMDALSRRLDSAAATWLRSGDAPGVSVAVVRGSDTLLVRAYGAARLAPRTAATPATVYRTGSVTKQFTAALVLQLVDSGRLRLGDSIATYLPGLPAAWRPVTVRQLLDHTSGIPSYTSVGHRWRDRSAHPFTPDSLVGLVRGDTMDFAPGTRWSYNNTGYVLLGMLLERLTGRPWAALVEERLLRPAGLAETGVCPSTPAAGHAFPYVRMDTGFVAPPALDMSIPWTAGSLCATARDLVRWNQSLHGGRVVSAAAWREMTTPSGATAKGPPRYAFGLIADSLAGHAMITHGGSIHGFMAANAWFPAESLSVTVLANSGNARPDELMRTLARLVLAADRDGRGARASRPAVSPASPRSP